MGEHKAKEQQCVFAVSYDGQVGDPDRTPVVVIGIPAGAWAHMADGKTNSFDLSSIGIGVKLMIFGAPTYAAAKEMLVDAQTAAGRRVVDATDQDFAMKPIEPKEGEQL